MPDNLKSILNPCLIIWIQRCTSLMPTLLLQNRRQRQENHMDAPGPASLEYIQHGRKNGRCPSWAKWRTTPRTSTLAPTHTCKHTHTHVHTLHTLTCTHTHTEVILNSTTSKQLLHSDVSHCLCHQIFPPTCL